MVGWGGKVGRVITKSGLRPSSCLKMQFSSQGIIYAFTFMKILTYDKGAKLKFLK